jgi:hypothetical protein
MKSKPNYSEEDLNRMRNKNNPKDEPIGDFTGRCKHCGSDDLWDDNLHYGCRKCGAILN